MTALMDATWHRHHDCVELLVLVRHLDDTTERKKEGDVVQCFRMDVVRLSLSSPLPFLYAHILNLSKGLSPW